MKTTEKGYGSRWQKARDTYLKQHPLCKMCERQGKIVQATVVDHIKPHKKDWKLFWNTDNWQALCKRCHDSHKQRQERGGGVMGCDADGFPIDDGHHWR